jgi:hypothetical protein
MRSRPQKKVGFGAGIGTRILSRFLESDGAVLHLSISENHLKKILVFRDLR